MVSHWRFIKCVKIPVSTEGVEVNSSEGATRYVLEKMFFKISQYLRSLFNEVLIKPSGLQLNKVAGLKTLLKLY